MKQITKNVIQITRMGSMNCYLVREDDGFTLVDTSLPGSAQTILKTAQQQGGEIKRIVLTHAHIDHVGSLDALKQKLPDVEVYLSERESALLAGDMSPRSGESQNKPRGGFPDVETTPDHLLNAGDSVKSLKVYLTPGHTPGHIAFLDTRDNTLLAGDAYHTLFGTRVTGDLNLLFPLPTFATWDKHTALKSAKAMHVVKPSRLAVGHGPVIENPADIMFKAIARASRNYSKQANG